VKNPCPKNSKVSCDAPADIVQYQIQIQMAAEVTSETSYSETSSQNHTSETDNRSCGIHHFSTPRPKNKKKILRQTAIEKFEIMLQDSILKGIYPIWSP